jgi:hypothetical protein
MRRNWLVENILDRLLKQNKNFLCTVVGETGQGKSYAAMRLCELVMQAQGREWDVEKYAMFWPSQFFRVLKTEEEGGYLTRGDIVLADEWELTAYNRNFMDVVQKAVVAVLSTFRRDNIAVLFTLPFFDMQDVHTRKLMHSYIHMVEQGKGKFYYLNVDHYTGDMYRRFKREYLEGFGEAEYANVEFGLPTDKNIEKYEELKKDVVADVKSKGEELALRAEEASKGPVRAMDIVSMLENGEFSEISDGHSFRVLKDLLYVKLQQLFPYRPISQREVQAALIYYMNQVQGNG